ncbi:hypothetical protein Patl1_29457 [Pistacia atlantica]|uniref:Uncharacterized protein n=1 Tax=Pistacia atlantica TaxID=434234 RepID=A0ACC1AF87_9ROSI|nr:hypothetical protein Patl1_29457 [Pistacia atlantica]
MTLENSRKNLIDGWLCFLNAAFCSSSFHQITLDALFKILLTLSSEARCHEFAEESRLKMIYISEKLPD